jgi:hypothetical protein
MGSECGLVWMIVVSTIDAHFPVSQHNRALYNNQRHKRKTLFNISVKDNRIKWQCTNNVTHSSSEYEIRRKKAAFQ